MKKKLVSLILALSLLLSFVPAAFADEKTPGEANPEYISEQLDFLKLLISDIQMVYKDKLSSEQLANAAYQGVIDALDPHSEYYFTTEEGDEFLEFATGEFVGVGVSIQAENGKCLIVAPVADSPADEAGIKAGDYITAIDGKSTSGKSISEIQGLLRGEKGTQVKVTVNRKGTIKDFLLVRDTVRTESVTGRMLEGEDGIAYIRITQFDSDTDNEFFLMKESLKAKGAKRFIVDLRDNPGGEIRTAVGVAGEFMKAGPVVYYMSQDEIVEEEDSIGTPVADLGTPLVVLVNENTASAAEILAGAWQDNGVAKVVGVKTFGKGTAQVIYPLNNGQSLKLSTYYTLTPKKHKVQDKISPDLLIQNQKETPEALKNQYNNFVPMSEKKKPVPGETGLNVYGAQQRLKMLGYDVNVSGLFDGKTSEAIKAFQRSVGCYSYACLDYTTASKLELAAYNYAYGVSNEDLQLKKGIEEIKKIRLQ